MSVRIQSLAELNQQVTHVLIREVGVVDAIRFLNQFRTGHGDYTEERERLFQGMGTKDIISKIKARRKTQYTPS